MFNFFIKHQRPAPNIGRLGEYLFGRPINAYYFRIKVKYDKKTGVFFSSKFCNIKKAMQVDFWERLLGTPWKKAR